MREILFRGKVINADNDLDGKWIFGQLVVRPDNDDGIDKTFICESGHRFIRCLSKMPCTYEVDPNTVGQYTGLKDKNGKRIFEGDFAGYESNDCARGVVKYGIFNCTCCSGVYGWEFSDGEDIRWHDSYIVIGNIHDNPELMYDEDEEE